MRARVHGPEESTMALSKERIPCCEKTFESGYEPVFAPRGKCADIENPVIARCCGDLCEADLRRRECAVVDDRSRCSPCGGHRRSLGRRESVYLEEEELDER